MMLPVRLWTLGVPAFAALVGLVAGVSPKAGIALALGTAFAALVLSDLAIGLALFVVVVFLESISGFGALSLAKLAGALLALSWLASVATDSSERRELSRDHPVAMLAVVALGAWSIVSVLWAEIPANALGSGLRWVLNLALFPIVYAAVRERRHVRWVFALFVFGALLSAGAGFLGGSATAAADGARLQGSGVNANELGELLIVAVILGGALGASRELSVPARFLSLAGSGVALIALLMTVSRGAILGLVVALLLAPLLVGPRRRLMALVLVVFVAGSAVLYLAAIAPESTVRRITAADTSGTGRSDIWKVGLRMVRAKPLIGVGAGNYANSTIHYLLEPGAIPRSEFIVDRPKVAHNVFLQVLAELGAIGLALFLGILAFSLTSILRAARAFRRAGDRSMELLSRGLLIALFGLLASAFFSSAIYSKQLWLLLALGVTLGALAPRERA
jgi:O-antigen ligase